MCLESADRPREKNPQLKSRGWLISKQQQMHSVFVINLASVILSFKVEETEEELILSNPAVHI